MDKQQAIDWCKRVQDGTYLERSAYLAKFGIGSIAKDLWYDPVFTLGVEYGILISLAKSFDLTPEDLK